VSRRSAGLLLHRRRDGQLEVLIGHMGGPLWARRERSWSIVKGEYEEREQPLHAARREFEEETGSPAPDGPLLELGEVRQAGGKQVIAWALAADFDASSLAGASFTMEWPPRSGRHQQFPELDRLEWSSVALARQRLVLAQVGLLDELERRLAEGPADASAASSAAGA
jgi:predicted NUDIX family NTP pyrophosphohydrolase